MKILIFKLGDFETRAYEKCFTMPSIVLKTTSIQMARKTFMVEEMFSAKKSCFEEISLI